MPRIERHQGAVEARGHGAVDAFRVPRLISPPLIAAERWPWRRVQFGKKGRPYSSRLVKEGSKGSQRVGALIIIMPARKVAKISWAGHPRCGYSLGACTNLLHLWDRTHTRAI
jgi:hypothetical protein